MIIFKNSFAGFTFNKLFDTSIEGMYNTINKETALRMSKGIGKKNDWKFFMVNRIYRSGGFNNSHFQYCGAEEYYL